MFREIRFYDDYTEAVASPGKWFGALGLNFLLLGLLIVIFPDLLAWLVAAFLILAGAGLLVVAWQFRRFKQLYRQWRESLWSP